MILTKLLKCKPRNLFVSSIRNLRSTIRIGREKFQLSVDVHQYNKDEIRVKARPDFLVIEGKQEKKTKAGYVMRRFVRKFRLPPGCSPKQMESKLSSEGILTITAPRKVCDENMPCETLIPIAYSGPQKNAKAEEIVLKSPCTNENLLDKSKKKP